MAELTAGFATLSLFLGWRLYVANKTVFVLTKMFAAMVDGELEIRKTEDGIEMEIKTNG